MVAAALGGIVGGVGSLFGAIMQARAQQQANQINWKNYYLQRDNSKKELELAQSARTDALGNKVEYEPGVGWKTVTTPLTKALLDANQVENYRRSTDDARLRRDALNRNDVIRRQAGEDARVAADEARYYTGPSNEDITLLNADNLISGRKEANRTLRDVLAKQALRTNNSAAIPSIVRETRKGATDLLGDALTKGKLTALTQGPQIRNAEQGALANRAAQLTQIASGMDNTPLGVTNANEELGGLQGAMLNAIMQGYGDSSRNQGNALGNLSAGLRDSYINPGEALGAIGAGIGGLFSGSGDEGASNADANALSGRQVGSSNGLTPEYYNKSYLKGGKSPSSDWWI